VLPAAAASETRFFIWIPLPCGRMLPNTFLSRNRD
jgi:hypothetical protein